MRFAHRFAGAAAFAVALATASATAFAGDGRAALDRVPKDYSMVLSINVDRAKGSQLYKDAFAMAAKNPETRKTLDLLKAQASFDFSRDVKTLVFGINGNQPQAAGSDPKMVVLVEGKFDMTKIGGFAKGQGKKVTEATHQGVKYWTVDDGEMALMAPYMAITPKGAMTAVIDVFKARADSVKKNAAFMKMLGSTDTSKDLWGVFLIPQQAAGMIKAQFGHGVDAAGMSVDIKAGMKSKVQVSTASDASAKALADMAKPILATASTSPEVQAMGLGAAVKRVTISTNKNLLNVAFDLTDAELKSLKGMLGAFMP
jgi:hypothetical protein